MLGSPGASGKRRKVRDLLTGRTQLRERECVVLDGRTGVIFTLLYGHKKVIKNRIEKEEENNSVELFKLFK